MRRVVITGFGAVTPIGTTRQEIIESLKNGTSAVVASPAYAELNFGSRVWAPVTAELPELDRRQMRFMGEGETLLYGYHAMLRAIADSGLSEDDIRSPETGCIVGTGGPSTLDQGNSWDTVRKHGPRKLGPYTVIPVMSSGLAAKLATDFGIPRITYSIPSPK